MTNNKKTFFFFLLFFCIFAFPIFVFAANANSASQDISSAVSNIFKWSLALAAILSACVIAYGGVLWMLQNIRGSFRQDSVDWMKAGITGLLITFCTWLIIYTINPKIFDFDINQLLSGQFQLQPGQTENPFEPKVINYNEIPIGKLAENLLASEVNCYEFDAQGNPIAGEEIKDDNGQKFLGPTYIGHDRIDCYLKLADAAEKKALIVENLSKEIGLLLSQCSCKDYGKCDDCNTESKLVNNILVQQQKNPSQCRLLAPSAPDGGGNCTGTCMSNKGCTKPSAMRGEEPELSCCSPSVRNQIKGYLYRHGDGAKYPFIQGASGNSGNILKTVKPFEISMSEECLASGGSGSSNPSTSDPTENPGPGPCGSYYCPTSLLDSAKNFFLSALGGQQAAAAPATPTSPSVVNGYCSDNIKQKYYGLDEFYTDRSPEEIEALVEENTTVGGEKFAYIQLLRCPTCSEDCSLMTGNNQTKCLQRKQKCLSIDRPNCINTTPWGKLNLIEQMTYLKTKVRQMKESIEKDSASLKKGASDLSSCSIAKSYIDLRQAEAGAKESEILLNINKTPDNSGTGEIEISNYCKGFNYGNSNCYQSCSEICPITKTDLEHFETCEKNNQCNHEAKNYQQCMAKKNQCISNYYLNRTCEGFGAFNRCVASCKNDCLNLCSLKYLGCSEQFDACQSVCRHDSSCVLGNLTSCVINSDTIGKCNSYTEEDDIKNCVNNSFTCKAGSKENAGYPECLKNPTTHDIFSSSYIWQNPNEQVCKNPLETGYGLNAPEGQDGTCVGKYQETSKCPASSSCPECKCDAIEQDFTFSLEEKVVPPAINSCNPASELNAQLAAAAPTVCSTTTIPVKSYRITGASCIEPAYNDDPLTFYCRENWWTEPETQRKEPVGKAMECGKKNEIPVGVLVDDSLAWADEFVKTIGKISENLEKMAGIMQKAGREKNACQCASKYEGGAPICQTCCQYIPPKRDQNGKIIPYTAKCRFIPCNGNSCQQEINWLIDLINLHTEIKKNLLSSPLIDDPRSDIFKELTYSREQVNKCSANQNVAGAENNRLYNCQKILDDIIPPILKSDQKLIFNKIELPSYCYGVMAGSILKEQTSKTISTDNWFCCSTVHQEAPEKSPYESPGGVF